ncbi:putative clathrin assembly protein At2g25430 [Sesamum indicum]|uniref:Clathrin assembly protein At2g25430 n=1 Tax=Sesamum indicum TaxID=4182 RepID=A0A6I9SLI5_SESIN|nr:putative clathrin assembly protein At2g25430 [Sesamum indicum]
MQRRFRQVFTSVKEHTCVSYAKIVSMGGFCDIDLIIVKATSPDDFPLPNKYVHEFLKIFSISPSSYRAFALSFSRRFGKTRSWRVAIKCLLLLHRLLRALPDDSPFRVELVRARADGLLSLYPSNFRDFSSSASEDYTSFIRSYARLLDEALDCIAMEAIQDERTPYLDIDSIVSDKVENQLLDEEKLPLEMQDLGRMIEVLPQLQTLIDRAIDCWPVGVAATSFLVQSAMKHITRDSFSFYTTFRREIVVVLENLIQLPYRSCVAAFGIYKKAAFQADQLCEFYSQCKNMGYCGSYEYPLIDRIPEIQIQALETFLNGMWQLTDHSSSSNISTQTSDMQSPSTDNYSDKQAIELVEVGKKDMELEPLIQWEVENNSVGWEDLLEASVSSNSFMASRNEWTYGNHWAEGNGGQLQVYNTYVLQMTSNPFYQQPQRTTIYYGSCPSTPIIHSWAL